MAPDWLLGCGVWAHADQLSDEAKSVRFFGIRRTGLVSQSLNPRAWAHDPKFVADGIVDGFAEYCPNISMVSQIWEYKTFEERN